MGPKIISIKSIYVARQTQPFHGETIENDPFTQQLKNVIYEMVSIRLVHIFRQVKFNTQAFWKGSKIFIFLPAKN